MNAAKLRLAGYLMLALGVAVGGGYGWARTVHTPRLVEIGSTACGLPVAGARFGVPLQAMLEAAGGLPFAIGPIEAPEGGGPITLRFEPSVDGAAHRVRLVGDALYLPTVFGEAHSEPRRITIHCREGVVGSVRYQGAGRESLTFEVSRASP